MKTMFSSDVWWQGSRVAGLGFRPGAVPLRVSNGMIAGPAVPPPTLPAASPPPAVAQGRGIPLGGKESCPVCPSFGGRSIPMRKA